MSPPVPAWVIALGSPAPEAWTSVFAELSIELRRVVGPGKVDDASEDTLRILDAETGSPRHPSSSWTAEVPDDALVLLWHAEGHAAALAYLSALEPPDLRGRVVVCAADAPPADLGAQVRNRGGLTWWHAPWAPWVLRLATEALRRRPAPGMLAPAPALERLQQDARVRPDRFLATIADAARQAVGADGAEVLLLPSGAEAPTTRLSWADGRVQKQPLAGDTLPQPPEGLAERALEWQQVVVLPDLKHVRIATGGSWAAAVAVPILRPSALPGPRTVLQVYWSRPLLPTPAELQMLRILGTAAAVNETRSAERDQLTRAHIESLHAITRVPWATDEAESTTEADLVYTFSKRVIQARASLPGLRTVYARLSTASRGKQSWQRVGVGSSGRVSPLEATRLDQTVSTASQEPPEMSSWDDGTFAIVRQLLSPDPSHGLGDVVATFADRTTADEARAALSRLCADLRTGLRLLRRSDDARAMNELARILSDATDAAPTLARMAGLIQRQLKADGVKVYVLSPTPEGGRLVQLYRTGRTDETRREAVVSKTHGLADWVVRHEDWICLEHPPPLPGAHLGPATGHSGRHGTTQLKPRPVSDYWKGDLPDSERTQLLVPLHHCDQVAGVLGVWRQTGDPFDAVLDVESMLGFAPHVASACARATALRQERQKSVAMQELARELRAETSLPELSAHILESARQLSGTSIALLFRHDSLTPGTLVVSAVSGDDGMPEPLRQALRSTSVRWSRTDTAGWSGSCEQWLQELDASDLQLHQLVVLPDHDSHAYGAVALLAGAGEAWSVPLLAEAATRRATESYLQFGGLLMANHVRVHAAVMVEQLSRRTDIDDPIQEAARRLYEMLPETVVVVTRGTSHRQPVEAVFPAVDSLIGLPVDSHAISRGSRPATQRLGDLRTAVGHARRMVDEKVLQTIESTLLSQGVRAWMGIPLMHGDRLRGVLHVFTGTQGPPLLAEHEQLGESLARWATEEAAKLSRRALLEMLNRITSELAGLPPNLLSERFPLRMQEWARAALHRSCQVGIVARSGGEHVLLCAGSSALTAADLHDLRGLSAFWNGEDHSWERRSRLPNLPKSRLPARYAGAAVALRLSNNTILEGHLFVLHSSPFREADREVLADGAREAAVLLHGEVVRHEWKLQAGLFRHALLGPVQGLQSAAHLLDELTRLDDPPEQLVQEARDTIASESETLHLWKETLKLITEVQEGEALDLRPRAQELRPLIQRCLARYASTFRLRNIRLHLDFQPDGGVRFSFDASAVDLILSNLLDNAAKYTFYNRTVRVEVTLDSSEVLLTVENIGTAIPPELDEAIYLPGTRARGRDPIRAIAGEGLGLFLSRTLARAHGGELTHTSEPIGVVAGNKQPHRVRFTTFLPHGWDRR